MFGKKPAPPPPGAPRPTAGKHRRESERERQSRRRDAASVPSVPSAAPAARTPSAASPSRAQLSDADIAFQARLNALRDLSSTAKAISAELATQDRLLVELTSMVDGTAVDGAADRLGRRRDGDQAPSVPAPPTSPSERTLCASGGQSVARMCRW